MFIGSRLKNLRIKNNMTQEEWDKMKERIGDYLI